MKFFERTLIHNLQILKQPLDGVARRFGPGVSEQIATEMTENESF